MAAPSPPILFSFVGTIGDDTLIATAGGSTINGLLGNDTLAGQGSNDALVGDEGKDSLLGGNGHDSLWGGNGSDTLDGGRGNDMLSTGSGGDSAFGGEGDDTVWGIAGVSSATLSGGNGNDVISGGGALAGGFGADSLVGSTGADTLDGEAGADTMAGGAGNDIYYVDAPGDVVIDGVGDGLDRVYASVSFGIGAQFIEQVFLTGEAPITAFGNAQNNLLAGNVSANRLWGANGDDTLDGGLGADTMGGGNGNDIYYVDNAADVVLEFNEPGYDQIFSSVTYDLTSRIVERLVLTGVEAINATGNSLANELVGNAAANRLVGLGGHDTLDGGGGADTMEGGTGNDIYYVDNVGDRVIEANGAGIDLVISSVTFDLGGQFAERLVLTGFAAINGFGNVLANELFGNAAANRLVGLDGADTLDGGLGGDLMEGGNGNDTYVVDNAADRVIEAFGAGYDQVFSSVAFSLNGQFAERLVLTGLAAINATGNALANQLVGNDAANRLDGLGGADTMEGGNGDDTYIVDNIGDRVIELPGNGTDQVLASVSFDLAGQAIENLRLTGTDAINGFGNELANVINGNAAGNLLRGGDGNDSLFGRAGDDTIEAGSGTDRMGGGTGNDLYRVGAADLTSADLVSDDAGTDDTLEIIDVQDPVFGIYAAVTISGSLANRIQGIEHFVLGSGNDIFLPADMIGDTADADVVTVLAGAGNDRLDVSQVARLTAPLAFLLDGGEGADTLIGGRGADTISVGSGDDRAFGGLGSDLVLVLSGAFDSTDTLNGEDGTDTLRFVGAEAVGAAAFANVSNIEVIELSEDGQALTLADSFAAGLGFTSSTIRGGAGDDLVDVSAFASNRRVFIHLGDGDDTLLGGAGNDSVFAGLGVDEIHVAGGINRVTFGAGELSGLDIVTASTTTAFDTLAVGVAAGRTLSQGAFAGVSGFDTFNFESGAGSAVRLPGTLVSQSGQASVNVNVVSPGNEGMAVDGRAIATGFRLDGGAGNDTLFAGSGADTLVGNAGDDVVVGGFGGDRIFLGTSSASRDIALLRSQSDGTSDINTTRDVAGADSVSGTEFEGNFIMADRFGFGLADSTTWFVGAAQNISLDYSAARLEGVSIAGDAFGTLTAVRNAVGARFTNNNLLEFEKMLLVITGASSTRFGVYYFEDRDHNTTVDSGDILRLLAVGTGAGPTFSGNGGFRLTSEFELL